MLKTQLIALVAAAAMLLAPAQKASADAGDAILGAIVGGMVTTAIINESRKNNPPNRTVVVRPQPESPQRKANRATQTALNYFGFNAGYADGLFGPQTASAVRGYQQFLGFPQTGKLTSTEHDILMNAYNRGQVGDYQTTNLINNEGVRALLLEQRNLALGPPANSSGATTSPAVAESDLGGTAAPEVTAADSGPTGLPLIPVPTGRGDLASFCTDPAITGARVTLASMDQPQDALNQVFCDARAQAIDSASSLAAGVQGVSAADIEAQCDALGPVMQPYVSALAVKPRADVVADVNGFISESGTDRTQLASTAEICLGTGYRVDNMNVAVGSALLLVALGEPGYGELMGHHLYHGFGTAANENRALEWLVWTTDELAAGATPVFGRGDTTRMELVDEAVYRLNGGAPSSAAKSTSSKGKLPVVKASD